MNQQLVRIVSGCLIALLPALGMAQTCTSVPTFTWRWWSNLAYPDDGTSGWGTDPETYSYIIDNKLGTFVDTDLDIGSGSGGEGKVRFISADFGTGAPMGWARVWSYSFACTSVTGNNLWYDNTQCYPGSRPATLAWVTLNNDRMDSFSLAHNTQVVLHEVGHVFGLKHLPNYCSNFMAEDPNATNPETLNSQQISWINSTY